MREVIYVEEFQKKQHLMDLLLEQPPARTLVFVKSKRACDSLDDYLYNLKFPCTSIHADRTQREREVPFPFPVTHSPFVRGSVTFRMRLLLLEMGPHPFLSRQMLQLGV